MHLYIHIYIVEVTGRLLGNLSLIMNNIAKTRRNTPHYTSFRGIKPHHQAEKPARIRINEITIK